MIRPREVGVAVLVTECCVAANTLAVILVPPLSLSNLGPLALAYHHSFRPLFLLPFLFLLLHLSRALQGVGRAALIIFVGAAGANIASVALWSAGVPDYLVFRRVDVIANVSDVLMIVSSLVVVASILRSVWRRYRSRNLKTLGAAVNGATADGRRSLADRDTSCPEPRQKLR